MSQRIFAAHISQHPISAHFRQHGHPRCRRLSDHTTRDAFHGSALYNDWYRPRGINHQLITMFRDGENRFVAVALSRGERRDFSNRDGSVGDLLVPHLIAGYRAALCASRVQQEIAQLCQGLESARAGVILLAEGGHLKLAPALARRRLAEYFGDTPCRSSTLPTPSGSFPGQARRPE